MTPNLFHQAALMTIVAKHLEEAAPHLDASRSTAIAAELLTPRRRVEARNALRRVLRVLDAVIARDERDENPQGGPLDRRATGECAAPNEGTTR